MDAIFAEKYRHRAPFPARPIASVAGALCLVGDVLRDDGTYTAIWTDRAPKRRGTSVGGRLRDWTANHALLEANQPLDARSRDVMKDGWDHGFDAASHVRAMDREGIDVAVLFRTVASMLVSLDEMEPDYSLALCQAFNDWVAGYCREDSARLKATAIVPQQDPVLAAARGTASGSGLGRGGHRPAAHAR